MTEKAKGTPGFNDSPKEVTPDTKLQGVYIDSIFNDMPSDVQKVAGDTKDVVGENSIRGILSEEDSENDTIGNSLLSSIQLYIDKYFDSVSGKLNLVSDGEVFNDMSLICEMRNLPSFSSVDLVTVENIIIAYLESIFIDTPEPIVIDLFLEKVSLDTIKSYVKNGLLDIVNSQHKILVEKLVEFSNSVDSNKIEKYQTIHKHISQNGLLAGLLGLPEGVKLTEEESDECMGYIHILQSIDFLYSLNTEIQTWAPSESDFEKFAKIS